MTVSYDAKKAREIVEAAKISKGCDYGQTTFAQGYLACLEGPEVKAFVHGINHALNHGTSLDAEKALAEFKREVSK